jgi:CheY-like chemotaxis protein
VTAVLVVDDEPDIRHLCRLILADEGYEVLDAETAEAALDLLGRQMADLVLLDIRMPGMGGWEMLRILRGDERWRRTPVVVCSAHASPVDRRNAQELGANGFLGKPFFPDELLEAVADAASAGQD